MNSVSAAEPANRDEESRFRITSQAEILSELRDALAQHALLTVCYGNDRECALSMLLEVDADGKTLTLDACQNPIEREKMLAAQTLTLETEVRRIRIRFDSGCATAATHDGQHAIRIALPTVMLRIQRREAYRIETPVTEMVNCRFAHPTLEHREVMLRVADLSVNGMGIIADSGLWPAEQGSVINECRIDLPDTGVLNCDAQIVRVYEILLSGKQRIWIGCQFVRLPGTAGSLLQRYILELERARMARARGIKL
jgi:flagellar brake protein